MKKIPLFLLLVLFLVVVATGCGKSQETKPATSGESSKSPSVSTLTINQSEYLKALVQQEKNWLTSMEPIHQQVKDLYDKFNQGSINREQLNEELLKLKAPITDLRKEFSQFNKIHKLTDEEKKSKDYSGSLAYGRKARSVLLSMIITPSKGVTTFDPTKKDSNGNPELIKKQLNDEELKKDFTDNEKKYQDYISNLKKTTEQNQ